MASFFKRIIAKPAEKIFGAPGKRTVSINENLVATQQAAINEKARSMQLAAGDDSSDINASGLGYVASGMAQLTEEEKTRRKNRLDLIMAGRRLTNKKGAAQSLLEDTTNVGNSLLG